MATTVEIDQVRDVVTEFVRQREDEVVELTCELIAAPSPNLPGDETAPAAVVQTWLYRYGLPEAAVRAKEPHRPNLILRIDGARPGPNLALCGHLDTKPVGDAADEWNTDPFEATIIGDRMYGLGSTDMKGACAAMVLAGAAFARVANQLSGSLTLVFTADEEYGSRYGAHYLTAERAFEADCIILGEPSGVRDDWDAIRIVSRGFSGFSVAVKGTQTHSSISDWLPTVNAVEAMARLMVAFRRELSFRHPDHALCPTGPTINIGLRAFGGYGYGVVPGEAEFWSDVRTTPGMTFEALDEDIRAALSRAEPELRGATYELQYADHLRWTPATEVPVDHPMVEATLYAAEHVLGAAPPLAAFPGATDACAFQVAGNIPTLAAFGPGQLPLAHGPNEWVSVKSLKQAAMMYALTAIEYTANSG
jgi:acetylornithine deacetylase/succinyl-diaminopimelate desuccinylase-like protein